MLSKMVRTIGIQLITYGYFLHMNIFSASPFHVVGATLSSAAEAALKGAEATKNMGSLAGRSNYVSEEKMQGVPDPGAAAIAAAFGALASAL